MAAIKTPVHIGIFAESKICFCAEQWNTLSFFILKLVSYRIYLLWWLSEKELCLSLSFYVGFIFGLWNRLKGVCVYVCVCVCVLFVL